MVLMTSSPIGTIVADHLFGPSDIPLTRDYSLDGEGLAVKMASARLIGQVFPGPGGKLGTFLWSGDMDMDGLTDIAIASSEAPGNPEEGSHNVGYVYIWLGSENGIHGTMDLDEVEPDILIRGGQEFSRLLSSMDVGDLNSDGIDDIVLGVSLHPSCGRVFILWGSSEGWPSVIDLYDPGRLSPNGDPYGFLRTEDYLIIGGHLSPVPWPEATYDTGDTVLVDDLDQDGKDDLILSSPGWHHVVIMWGQGSKYTLGNEMTIIDDPDLNSKIGDSMTLGDIDNDGWTDLVAGAPYQVNSTAGRYECGIVFVILNLSRARSSSQFNVFDLSHPIIWGSGSYDRFGYNVQIADVNDDGYDDILVGSPDADGPQNTRNGAGELLIFKGGVKATFPRYMDAASSCDIMIIGDRIATGDLPGDAVGRSFAVGDIDGDQGLELVIGFPRKLNEYNTGVGSMACYETNRVFTTPSSLVDLRSQEKRFEFYGETQNDNLAYTLLIADINNDGAAELLAGAPGADGQMDTRVDAGEVYILNGTKISIGDIALSGPGVKDDLMDPGGGQVYMNFTFRHSTNPRSVDNAYVVLEPGILDGRIGLVDGSMFCDARSIYLDVKNSSVSYIGSDGKVSMVIEPGWNLRIGRSYDIEIVVGDSAGALLRRYIPDRFRVVDRIDLATVAVIKVNGQEIGNKDPWLKASSTISFSGLEMVYDRPGLPRAPYDIATVELFRDDLKVDTVLLDSPSAELKDTIPETGSISYSIKPVSALDLPNWEGLPLPVEFTGSLRYDFKVDNEAPDPVYGLYLEPDEGRHSLFDDDTEWTVGWTPQAGDELDEGSNVRYFNVQLEGREPQTSKKAGGLLGSYFNGPSMNSMMFTRIDGPLDFSIEEWGKFGPDPNTLDYYSFSIRWDGWFRVPSSRMYQFSISGTENGHGMLVLNGAQIIPWSELVSAQNSIQRFLNEGDVVPIQVYYYFDTTNILDPASAFCLRYLNDKGTMVPIPSDELLCSSNEERVQTGYDDMFTVSVNAVDWVGLSSEPATITGYLDRRDPVFNLSAIEPWYGSSSPVLKLGIRDPSHEGIPSSGIDQGTIGYRIRERDADSFGEWSTEGFSVTYSEKGLEANTSIIVEHSLELTPSWRGTIQWRVADIVGNLVESSVVDIGVDNGGPEFELLSPNIQIVQDEGLNSIIVKAMDRPGSGVDADSVQYRSDTGTGWSEWIDIEVNGSGTEIVFDVSLYLPSGTNRVQFRASDLVGNVGVSDIYTIMTEPVVMNHPPVPGIRSPENATTIRIGNLVTLDASDTTDDGHGPLSDLVYTWISNLDGYLGNGRVLDVYLESTGEHRVRLYVDDGEFNISVSVYITVEDRYPIDDDVVDDDLVRPKPDYLTPLIISLVLIIVLVLGIFFVYRRYHAHKEEETRLEFVERTDDDIDYESRSEEEEKTLGINEEDVETTEEEVEDERKKLYG